MAQSTILAAGTTAATSSDVTIAPGDIVKVGLFVATGELPAGPFLYLNEKTPGSATKVTRMDFANPSVVLMGPGTYNVSRPSLAGWGTSIGVFKDE